MNQKSVTTNAIIDSTPNKILNGSSSSPIRLQKQVKKKLDGLLTRADKNRVGRKIRVDYFVGSSLELLNNEQLKYLKSRLLTNKVRIEILFKKLSKTKRGLSREGFLGMLLEGKTLM